MADDISVKISAQIGELQSGLNEATAAIKNMAAEVQDSFGKAGEAGEAFGSKLGTALNLGLFLELQTVATEALHAVEEAFNSTVGKAEEFGLSNAKLAARLGVSVQEAAALSASLRAVGSSGDEFAAMADRLVLRLRQNEQAFTDLGIKTRDANGQLLNGEQIMQNAVATMETFKTGTDQNAFAHEVFGRSVSGVYDIMRVTQTQIQRNKDLMAELGVVTGGEAAGAASKLQLALAETRDQFEFAAVSIGQHLMPVVTNLIEQFNANLTPVLKAVETSFREIVVALDFFATVFVGMGNVVGGVLVEIGTALAGFATLAYDVLTGQWGKVTGDFQDYTNRMKTAFDVTLNNMAAEAQGFVNRANGVFAGLNTPEVKEEQNPYGGGTGTKSYRDPKQARAVDDEIAASDKALALEQIKIEEDKNNSTYALGQKSMEDHLATALALENQKEAIELEYLTKKEARDAGNVLELQKDKDKELLVEEQHVAAVQKLEEQAAAQRQQMRQQESAAAAAEAQTRAQQEIAHAQAQVKLHEITQEQEFAMEANLTTELYQQDLQRLDNDNATLVAGTRAYEKYQQDRVKLTEKYNGDIQKLNDKAAEYSMQKWDQLGSSIKGSFTSAINGMILGTKTWQKALGEIIDGVATAFLKMAEDMLTQWIATELKKMLFSQTTAATSAVSQVSSAAGVAGANTFASTSAIPIVGPELAPAAAAAAVGETMGFSSLAVAEKGMVLDSDRLVSAHKEEMILPADISGGLQNLIKGGGANGESHLHFAPTINGGQASLKDMLAGEANHMRSWFKEQVRTGAIRMPGVR